MSFQAKITNAHTKTIERFLASKEEIVFTHLQQLKKLYLLFFFTKENLRARINKFYLKML